MAGHILIVDDEVDLADLLDLNLRREGFATQVAHSGREALDAAIADPPSLVVLDLMLPDVSGTEVCRRLRANPGTAKVPVIMLTAKGEEIDRVVGFEVGADDYVVKTSFSVREFILRVRAVLRRGETVAEAPVAVGLTQGPLRIDDSAHRVFVEGEEVQLTATEFKLLATLARNSGKVLSRGHLLEEVWDMPPDLNTRTVDTHVKRLREKLGAAAPLVETVRGVGYRFNKTPGT